VLHSACALVIDAFQAVRIGACSQSLLAGSDDPVAIGDRGIGVADAVQQVEVVGDVTGRASSSSARPGAIGSSAADADGCSRISRTQRQQQVNSISYIAGIVQRKYATVVWH
jgi:hypothetical protein